MTPPQRPFGEHSKVAQAGSGAGHPQQCHTYNSPQQLRPSRVASRHEGPPAVLTTFSRAPHGASHTHRIAAKLRFKPSGAPDSATPRVRATL